MTFRCELHPIYGAVHRDGDRVYEGEALGLSPNGMELVTAPVSGVVRFSRSEDGGSPTLVVEILPSNPTPSTPVA